MKKVFYWGGGVLLALLLGVGSALLLIRSAASTGNIKVGPWTTGTNYGSADADMYTRARVAVFGLLALSKKETIYYTAGTDSSGAPLSGDCTYVVRGRDLPARWWSVTAYGPDSYLIANDAGIYSFSQTSVHRDADGNYAVRISADRQDGDWLPVKAGRRFDLTARLYNPDPSVYAAPGAAALPTIEKEVCK